MKPWIGGAPTIMTIDDNVPFYNNNLLFDMRPSDGSLWAVLLEKAWAKINGNYENINYGW